MEDLLKEENKYREKEKQSADPVFETKTKESGETYIGKFIMLWVNSSNIQMRYVKDNFDIKMNNWII